MLLGLGFSLAAGFKLAQLGPYDLVMVGTNPPSAPLVTQLVPRIRKTPYVYLIHDLYPDIITRIGRLGADHPVARLTRSFQKKWLGKARKVIVLGHCMREHLIDSYGVPGKNVEVITNWANPREIPVLPKTTRFREKNHLEGFVVLWAGNFGQYQNFDDILGAARVLQAKTPDITFVFVGEGAKKDYVVWRVKEEGLQQVRFFPYVPNEEFPDLLASADVSLVTLEADMEGVGVPSKFYNILASGRPTLAILGPSSEVARVLEEYGCGVRVDRGRPEQLAEEVLRLFRSPEALSGMGENARKALLEQFTIDRIARQYYQVFREAVLMTGKVG